MEIYLPIIQVKIDILFILFLSFAVGVLSGLFGVGGGFLMTPFLIFLGIPPVYAIPKDVPNKIADKFDAGKKMNKIKVMPLKKYNPLNRIFLLYLSPK